MDTDLSHEAIARFDAIDQRLDALESAGGTQDTSETEVLTFGDPEDDE